MFQIEEKIDFVKITNMFMCGTSGNRAVLCIFLGVCSWPCDSAKANGIDVLGSLPFGAIYI